jgi:hypothetical protein
MVGEVPVRGVRHHAHLPRRFTEHHGVRATRAGQLEPCGDQTVADGASRTARLRLVFLHCWSAGLHDDRITKNKWTASTLWDKVDAVHYLAREAPNGVGQDDGSAAAWPGPDHGGGVVRRPSRRGHLSHRPTMI